MLRLLIVRATAQTPINRGFRISKVFIALLINVNTLLLYL